MPVYNFDSEDAMLNAAEHMFETQAAINPDLPDDIRVPLFSLQADIDYLFGRVVEDASTVGAMAQSVKRRLAQIEQALSRYGLPTTQDREDKL